ncbi:MAG: hypothetical protein ACRDJE_19505 [Dehalococcoidia bacterium]
MKTDQQETLVFKDQVGEYYLVPQETLEQGRVPTEHKAEIERFIAASEAAGGDVQGYAIPLIVPVVIIGVELALIIGLTGPEVPKAGTMTNAQWFERVTGQPFPR